MTKFFGSFLMLMICITAFPQDKDVAALTVLNSRWLASYPVKNKATLNEIFADDFVLISHKGTKMSKWDIIDNLDKQETVSIDIDSLNVRLLTKKVGLVTVYTTFVLKVDGKDLRGQNCYQDVYVKRRGKWLAVSAHVTLLNMQ